MEIILAKVLGNKVDGREKLRQQFVEIKEGLPPLKHIGIQL